MSVFAGHAHYRLTAVGVFVCFITTFSTTADAALWSELLYFWSSDQKEDAVEDKPKASFSVGSHFGDASETTGTVDPVDRFAPAEPGPNLGNLLSRDGATWAFMTLRTERIQHIKAFQIGTFRVGGLGAGFDDGASQTVQVSSREVIPGGLRPGPLGFSYVPEQIVTTSKEQKLTGSSDEATSLGGVEFNVLFKDKINFAGASSLEAFAGARFLNFGDSYSTALSSSDGTDSFKSGSFSVTNRLVGTQFGASGRKFLSEDMLLTGRLAFGLFANFVDQGNETSVTETQVQRFSNIEDSDTGFAQMVEFSPTLHVRLKEKVFLSLGGTMMWLNGVRRLDGAASNGLTTTGAADDETSSYLYYGGKATLKWTFN